MIGRPCISLGIALLGFGCGTDPVTTTSLSGRVNGRDDAGIGDGDGDGDGEGDGDDTDDDEQTTDSDNPTEMGKCDQGLQIIVRDFTEMHPDFEKFSGALQGIVQERLADTAEVRASVISQVDAASPERRRLRNAVVQGAGSGVIADGSPLDEQLDPRLARLSRLAPKSPENLEMHYGSNRSTGT